MGIGNRIREARESLNMTQEQLGTLVGVTKSAITNYENEVSRPKEKVLYELFRVLRVEQNYLFQDVAPAVPEISVAEKELLKRYRRLDEHGKELIDAILDIESRRTGTETAAEPKPAGRIIPLFGARFAAGAPETAGDLAWEDYATTDPRAEFAIHVNGNSMEPVLPDGSIALGERRAPKDGEIGAFRLDGEFLVKQICQDASGRVYLFSVNRDRADADITIEPDSGRDLWLVGTILAPPVALP